MNIAKGFKVDYWLNEGLVKEGAINFYKAIGSAFGTHRDSIAIKRILWPERYNHDGTPKFCIDPIRAYTLDEVMTNPGPTYFHPNEVDLSTQIGPARLNCPILSAAMDTVTGPELAIALRDAGGCGVLPRMPDNNQQLDWLERVLNSPPCLVKNPKILRPYETLGAAEKILKNDKFSTIPVVGDGGVLLGILFTQGITFDGIEKQPVSKYMKTFRNLKWVSDKTSFDDVRRRLKQAKHDTVLPVLDQRRRLKGIYFKKDLRSANPSWHNDKAMVGMAVGTTPEDLQRVKEALKLGVAIIVIDSSHGNCPDVLAQAARIVKLARGKAAVIGGNIADIDGYLRFAEIGVDAVKPGIGSGAICTTSDVTGAGVPMHTLNRMMRFTYLWRKAKKKHAPPFIPDGGVNGPGYAAKCFTGGACAVMAGKWMAAAFESRGFIEWPKEDKGIWYARYRGMASASAIADRLADRYDKEKRAPEGVDGHVPVRGPLRSWLKYDLENIRSGLAHDGANTILAANLQGDEQDAFYGIATAVAREQIGTRVVL